MTLTNFGKFAVASNQFQKGTGFLAAAILLKKEVRQEAHQYVYLHLLCQGIELTMKGLLLFRDYDKYRPKEKAFGHKIDKLVEAVCLEYRQKPMNPQLADEVKTLSAKFAAHQLRYATGHDLFIDPFSIATDNILLILKPFLRLAYKNISNSQHSQKVVPPES